MAEPRHDMEFNAFLAERRRMARRPFLPFLASFSLHAAAILLLLLNAGGTGYGVASDADFITGTLVIEQPFSGAAPAAARPGDRERLPAPQPTPKETRPEESEPPEEPEEEPVRIPETIVPDRPPVKERTANRNKNVPETRKGKGSESAARSGPGAAGLVTGIPGLAAGRIGSGIEAGDFPYAWYINSILRIIHSNWENPFLNNPAATALHTTVYFQILRSGELRDVRIESASGNPYFDMAAERAVRMSSLPPLPPEFSKDSLVIHYRFEYAEEVAP
jgi:protein TonB